jgi:cobalt-zinc-cadmium efflux system outer membrane protein
MSGPHSFPLAGLSWRSRARLASLAAILLGLALPAQAQDAYSLPQLIEMAQAQHPRMQAAREQVNAASAAVVTAGALPNPELEVLGGSQRARAPGGVPGNFRSVMLTQRLDLPAQRSARINAANAGLDAEQAQLRLSGHELVRAIKLHYYLVLRREAEREAALQDLKTLAEIRDRVKVRVDTGEAPRYDMIKADAEVLNAQKQAHSASLRVELAKAALRNSVGDALPASFELAALELPATELPPLPELEQQVLSRNAVLVRGRALTARGREQLALERSLRMPAVSVKAGVEQDPEVRGSRVGLNVSIPLWDRRRGPLAEAGAQLARLEFEQDQARFDLRQQLHQAYQQYQISSNQLAALESGILAQAQAALRVAEAAYRFGERGILDYLDAQRAYRNARNELIAARHDMRAALIDIETLHQE